MKFYKALEECVENGKKITRTDWNGKGMYVYYAPPQRIHIDDYMHYFGVPDDLTEQETEYQFVKESGYFVMKNAQGIRIIGWLATQTDMVSDKWEIVE